jgi:hypothetical protein
MTNTFFLSGIGIIFLSDLAEPDIPALTGPTGNSDLNAPSSSATRIPASVIVTYRGGPAHVAKCLAIRREAACMYVSSFRPVLPNFSGFGVTKNGRPAALRDHS